MLCSTLADAIPVQSLLCPRRSPSHVLVVEHIHEEVQHASQIDIAHRTQLSPLSLASLTLRYLPTFAPGR